MKLVFPDLPYPTSALEPHCSQKTLELHHGKHHRTYFDTTVKLIEGTRFEDMTLDEIVHAAAKDKKHQKLFNNAAQAWNHDVFWKCMHPSGGGKPEGALADRIDQDFGSYDDFRKTLHETAVTQFGSGWAWLVWKRGKLSVLSTSNAETPMVDGATVLLTIDVWEHAYYLDYQNRRPAFLDAFLDHLVNWQHASEMLKEGLSHGEEKVRKRA